MDKLVFNEGGQPLYLDDLQTLQTLAIENLADFIFSLVLYGIKSFEANCCWIKKPTFSGGYSDLGYLFHRSHGVIAVPNTYGEQPITDLSTLYLDIVSTPTDQRTLDNGQQAYCGEKVSCVYTDNASSTSIQVSRIADFITLIKQKLV